MSRLSSAATGKAWAHRMRSYTSAAVVNETSDADPFEVSDADTMLKHIDPNWQDKPAVSIITKPGCGHCAKAKDTLKAQGLDYEEIVLGKDASMTSIRAMTGRDTAPQVFIGGKHIGGNDDLQKYFADNK